jgi:hypothetical protein
MLYELKTYHAQPGKHAQLTQRFHEVTLPIFARVGIEVVGCWTKPEDPDALVYLTRFATDEARRAAWAAFGADAEWLAAKAASETNGPLLLRQESVALQNAPFWPESAS